MSISARRHQWANKKPDAVTTLPLRGPASFRSLSEAKTALQAPADANYVMWNSSWAVDRDLEDIFATEIADNDILVLPERVEPYTIDSSEGFRAAGVKSVTGRYGELPIYNTYKGVRGARTWFAMARARRGILGMGPGTVIKISQSSWTQEPQIEDAGSVQPDGWTSPGRKWTDTSDVQHGELIGSQEKILEANHDHPYFGNFCLRAHDLGGVAFNGIAVTSDSVIFERLDISNGWRGFMGMPNGETGALSTNGGTYAISRCILGTRDDSGVRVGSSPIMINSATGGSITLTDASEARAGMLTIWNSSGKHVLTDVNCRFNNNGYGLNLEQLQQGFELEWNGGSNWADYQGKGGKTPKPADQGINPAMHLGVYAPVSSCKITLRGVDLDTGHTPGALNVQGYGASQQLQSDITCYDTSGNSVPVMLYK